MLDFLAKDKPSKNDGSKYAPADVLGCPGEE
jgi:hypothetical protein